MQFFRHLAQKLLAWRQPGCVAFVQSDKKIADAIRHLELCGITQDNLIYRNEHARLDQPVKPSDSMTLCEFLANVPSPENKVCLFDFIEGLSPTNAKIARMIAENYSTDEILQACQLTNTKYRQHIAKIREAWENDYGTMERQSNSRK